MNADKINGIGAMFRFITPTLIIIFGTLCMIIFNGIDTKIEKLDTKICKLDNHFLNHLSHHNLLEKEYEHRITELEVK